MKRMLINATQEEELRVAMVDGQKLYDLDIESPSQEQRKANIYKGRITRIEQSLDAAFVDYGADRHGFLPMKEISREYFVTEPSGERMNIRELLREGQEIVVQVDKEERGNKGAALTTFISLAGRFIVLMPNNPRGGGVSRRISGEERDEIREALHDLEVPGGMGVIIRTAGVGRSTEELNWDMQYLLSIWEAIKAAVVSRPAPFLIFQDSNAIIRALRDHLANDVGEIIIDDPTTHEEARQFMERVMPQNLRKLRMYQDPVPLFTRFQIESQIESAFSHVVTLPSGGSLVIEQTEALVSIDINSARSTKGEDIEATAFATNLEAADEVARQCRLRDLGGLLVVDFIDMSSQRSQREVENRLRDAMKMDRARVQIGRISRFGLLELSRQRLRPSLGESAHQPCPRCNGSGSIRGVESLALAVLRLVGEEARKDRSSKVIAQLPVDVATYLLNEKRDWIRAIEERDHVQLVLIANPHLETPNYSIRRVRDDQVSAPENTGASYTLAAQEQPPSDAALDLFAPRVKAEEPAVVPAMPATPAPPPPPEFAATESPAAAPVAPTLGLIPRLKIWLFGSGTAEPAKAARPADERRRDHHHRHEGSRHRDQHGRGRRDDRYRDERRGGRGHSGQTGQGGQGGQGGQNGQERREGRGERDGRDQRGQRPPRQDGGRPQEQRGEGRFEPRQGDEQRRGQAPRQGANGSEARSGEPDQTSRRDRSRPRRRGGRGGRGGGEDRQGREGLPPGSPAETRPGPEGNGFADQQAGRDDGPTPRPEPETRADRHSDAGERPQDSRPDPSPVAAPSTTAVETAAQEPGDRPRQLPWEPPASGGTRSYTVWSSGPGDTDATGRDRE
ncbi:MAG: Rne/Rng family ribonuclease [Gammaproteobacteria bacterium]|nr:Rne/Rng family ribonuclease [Gammaproteobacteria bacterium]